MTVATSVAKSGPYAGAGTTGPYTVGFPFVDATHLRVTRTTSGVNTTLVYGVDYSVTGAGGASGTVTLTTALAFGEQLTITRNVPFTQLADYVTGDSFPAESHEQQLDLACQRDQQIQETIGRALALPVNSPAGISTELPPPQADKIIGWNSAATGLRNMDPSTLASVIAFAAWQSQLFSGTGAQTAFSLSSDPGNINNLDVAINGVTQRPGVDFTLAGTTVTFTAAPAAGTNNVLARWGQALPQGTGDDSQVAVQRAGLLATTQHAVNAARPVYPFADCGAAGDNVTDDTTALTRAATLCPAYGVIDLGGYTYRITSPIAGFATGVTVRNGRIRLDNPTATYFYALVASDYCKFEHVHMLGAGVTGDSANVGFTGSVGGATSGTLTAPITNGSYVFTFSNGNTRYVTVTGGTACSWTGALTAGTVTTATYPTTARYQGGIFSGNTDYPAPMNRAPANHVKISGCTFESLTVGVWAGGAVADAVPENWQVYGCTFLNIVGRPGLSEGYGLLFTPAKNSVCAFNTFKNIRRHAIYGASEWANCVVHGNVIDGCDNIAIQSNTFVTQNYADGNIISDNTIRGLTRSVPYGYRSSIGIGLYGKFQNTLVEGNRIHGAQDTGIDNAGALSGAAYSANTAILGNYVRMDPTATDAGIRCDDLQSGRVAGNYILLTGLQNGVTITSTVTATSTLLAVEDNTVETTDVGAVAFRVALAAQRFLRIFRNTLNGFAATYTNRLNDTSTAGVVRSDLNARVGFFGSDAGFTHNSGGSVAQTDCPFIRHAGVLTATRTVTLSETNVDQGAEVTLTRTGGGAFNLDVKSASTVTLKSLTGANQWARFAFNQSSQWELVGYGNL